MLFLHVTGIGIGINGNSKSDFIIFGKALQVISYLERYWGTVIVWDFNLGVSVELVYFGFHGPS